MRLSILSRLREINASTKKRRNAELEAQDGKRSNIHKYRNKISWRLMISEKKELTMS